MTVYGVITVELDEHAYYRARTHHDGMEFVAGGFATYSACLQKLADMIADHNWQKRRKVGT